MKKIIATLCAALACSFLFTTTPVYAENAYTMTMVKSHLSVWSNGKNKVYLKDITKKNKDGIDEIVKQKLYLKDVKTGKSKLLQTIKLDPESEECCYLNNVYKTTVYMNRVRGVGDGNLYTYNWKTGKFKCVRKNFIIINASGKYMITANYLPTDISPYPAYLYKITSKGLEKVKKLGAYTTQAQFAGRKIYYAKFPSDGSIRQMSVWTCDLSGKHAKEIFRTKAKDEQGYVMLQHVDENSFVYVEVPADGDPVYYRFDMKTEKTTQIPESEVQ